MFMLSGAINVFDPVDLLITDASNLVRAHDASGDIVVVGVDEYTGVNGFAGSIPDHKAYGLIEALLNAGIKKVVISAPVQSTSQEYTKALDDLLQANSDRVFLAKFWPIENEPGALNPATLINSDTPVHYEKTIRYWGGVEKVTYTISRDGLNFVSAESVLTDQLGKPGQTFPIDYAIDITTIPYVEFTQSDPTTLSTQLADKLVIAGFENSGNTGTVRVISKKGQYSKPTITALAAETLHQGRPYELSPYWIILLLLPFLYAINKSKNLLRQLAMIAGALIMVLSVKLLLDHAHIIMSVGHAIMMVVCTAPFSIYGALKAKSSEKNAAHPVSGLPALHQLSYAEKDARPLIVAHIVEFEEWMGLLAPADRKNLSERIAALATSDGQVWHGENGHFYWFLPHTPVEQLSGHLEGLNLILRNGFSAGNLPVSLTGIFGVDLRADTNMSDRIIGANLSAKRAAANNLNWLIYEAGDKSETEWTITKQRELDIAIEAGQISAALQPKVNIKSGEIIGFEALARWTHPQRGQIRPDEFIEAAEEGGCIEALTVAVVHSAFKSFRYALQQNPDLTIAINITPSLLSNPGFCELVSSLLAYHDIEPTSLVLEITESNAFANDETCISSMHKLVSSGVTLSIDDYGTGNSTLEYMRNIPAGELKIDRTFISQLMTSEEDKMLIRSTINLAHKLNMVVVAEGIEDKATLEELADLGCDLAQGYLISRPLSPDHFVQFIDEYDAFPNMLTAS